MKHFFLYILFMLLAGSVNGQNPKTEEILGYKWVNPHQTAQIEFYAQQGKYFACLHLLMDADAKDAKNSNKALRSRQLEGQTIVFDLAYANGKYSGGTIYSPERGQTFTCKIEWVDASTLAITGSKGILSQTARWKRQWVGVSQ